MIDLLEVQALQPDILRIYFASVVGEDHCQKYRRFQA